MNKMTPQQPAIFVTLMQGCSVNNAAQLFYGIEEEGIPFLLTDEQGSTTVQCAYNLACRSPLSVGVAVSQTDIVIHYKNLPSDNPLFVLNNYSQDGAEQVRALGCNAARLVKGLPFKDNH